VLLEKLAELRHGQGLAGGQQRRLEICTSMEASLIRRAP
jgi:ABC-type lipopolysaccharide export system ATPase subunit